jgi:hypothetical protein
MDKITGLGSPEVLDLTFTKDGHSEEEMKKRASIVVRGAPSRSIDYAREILSLVFDQSWEFTKITCNPPSEDSFYRNDWLISMDACEN